MGYSRPCSQGCSSGWVRQRQRAGSCLPLPAEPGAVCVPSWGQQLLLVAAGRGVAKGRAQRVPVRQDRREPASLSLGHLHPTFPADTRGWHGRIPGRTSGTSSLGLRENGAESAGENRLSKLSVSCYGSA